jgi:hypothetical protein
MMMAKLALLATALFTGAAVYITFVEHPARMLCPTPWAVAQWRPSYKHATVMQASLAVIRSLAAVSAFQWARHFGESMVSLQPLLILFITTETITGSSSMPNPASSP